MEAEAIHAELEAAQVVDHAIFDGVRAIPGLMDTVVEQVDANLTQMNAIRGFEEISQEQLHKFGELGHALRSGICMIGCERLALLCTKIEMFGREGEHQNPEALIWCFDTYMNSCLQEAMEALEALLGDQ
eukprot:m.249547 g.249547  ORF g.249547 m.249547 type:complete len:130 (+) comp26484_c1_seq1:1739-2128(+)